MFRLVANLVIATIVVATPSTTGTDGNCKVFLSTFNITTIKALYPNAESTKLENHDFGFTLGNRINGDKLVCVGSNITQLSSPQNVKLIVQYPYYQQGDVVTYVKIDIKLSTNVQITAHLVNGGIGQRNIFFLIDVYSTRVYEWAVEIYGY